MIEQTDKAYNAGHKVNQNQNKQKVFTHRRHYGDIKTQQKNQAAVDNQCYNVR